MHCVTMCWYVCLFVVVVLFIVALYSLSRMFPQTITVCSLLVASIVHCLFVACLSRKAKTCLFVILFVCCVVLFVLFVMFVFVKQWLALFDPESALDSMRELLLILRVNI